MKKKILIFQDEEVLVMGNIKSARLEQMTPKEVLDVDDEDTTDDEFADMIRKPQQAKAKLDKLKDKIRKKPKKLNLTQEGGTITERAPKLSNSEKAAI